MISCYYIRDVYKNYIHQNLIDNEIVYSILPIEDLELLISQINYLGRNSNNRLDYYLINNTIIFEVKHDRDYCDVFICSYSYPYDLESKIGDILDEYFQRLLKTNRRIYCESTSDFKNKFFKISSKQPIQLK